MPELFFLPSEDINNKVVRACNGILAIPGKDSEVTVLEGVDKEGTKEKTSDLPIRLIYPNDLRYKTPECQQISNQIFNP